ncbi:DUF454 domain-containing protein [Bacteroidetes/Chlorobi group bacterium Naka2016]|jgi:uncharacterized membrane protein YbaN (DUF454 family)|nr:MAG: DUF454 domain-containing protein [Bacteroidetes/Chlorobi group bacterium Naka2016]
MNYKFVSKTKKWLFVALGFISLGLAVLGIFLPILPTTPFLLLSAYIFAKSSPKLYNWLLSTKRFGKIIRDYREKKGVALPIKIYAISLLWLTILISVVFVVDIIYLDILLLTIASVVTYHILKLKTLSN